MPVIVIGADTGSGRAIIDAMVDPNREIRAFVSDPDIAADLRSKHVKVAIGDVSDDSHIEGAAIGCFTAVLVAEAAYDERERAFASDARKVLEAWARAIQGEVRRAIWVSDEIVTPIGPEEVAVVSPDDPELVRKVVELDNAQTITSRRPG